MEIPRYVQTSIEKQLGKQKVVLLYGTRRSGKTTIIENIFHKNQQNTLFLLGEDVQVAELLSLRSVANYKQIVGDKKIVIIDEAQVVPMTMESEMH